MKLTDVLDGALDRSIALGYSNIGSKLRRLWWPADPPPRALAGKRVVVTGATSGLGEAMAKSFAELGATVHLLGRNPEKVRHSAGVVRGEVPGSVVIDEVCDVADLDAVRAWTDDLSGRIDALHGLVHNAGAMPKERDVTAQGHETQLACHVLGPHLMTDRLIPLLRNADGSSVVFMSSGGMYTAALEVDDMESAAGEYEGIRAYARTKRMQVVLADAWAERLAGNRRPRREHASRLGGDARGRGIAADVPEAHPAVPARHHRRRGHRGVARRDPPDLGTPALLARPRAAADDLRVATPREPDRGGPVPRRGLGDDGHDAKLGRLARLNTAR